MVKKCNPSVMNGVEKVKYLIEIGSKQAWPRIRVLMTLLA